VLQVCGNLISNAIKFCRPGDTVTVTGEPTDDHVLLSVADTGPGVEPELVPHLFEPYWSAPEHAKHGTGLGLYIAKGIVEAHGGRIWVESQPGAGARFFFTLPSRANGRVAYPPLETDPGAPLP
jgi:signal transduction histidine kinase